MTGWEIIERLIFPLITGLLGWFGSKFQTTREKKKTDLEIINGAIEPLLKSIADLTATVERTNSKLIAEQEKNLALLQEKAALLAERETLTSKIESLEKKVARLTKMVQNLTKENEKEHISDSGD